MNIYILKNRAKMKVNIGLKSIMSKLLGANMFNTITKVIMCQCCVYSSLDPQVAKHKTISAALKTLQSNLINIQLMK